MVRNGATGGSPTMGIDNYGSELERRENDYQMLQGLLGSADAGGAAQAALSSDLEKIGDALKRESDRRENAKRAGQGYTSMVTDDDLTKLKRWYAIQQEGVQDAINPLGKMNREMENALKVQELQAQGLSGQAEWQGKLNDLIEQHTDLSKIDLVAEKARFDAGQIRARQLQDQIDLTSTLNDVTVDQITRNGTRRDSTFAGLVSGALNEGESYGAGLSRLGTEGRLGSFNARADAMESNARDTAVQGMMRDLAEMRAQSGMSGSQRSWRSDYKGALEELTGMTGTLEELTAKSDSNVQALAKHAADVKQAFENPPGFQRWVESLEPFAKRMEDIKFQFVDDLSNGITDALMGDKVDWSGMIKNARRSLMKAFVDEQMKGVLGKFGIGKAATPEAQALMSAADLQMAAAVSMQNAANAVSVAAGGSAVSGSSGIPGLAANDNFGSIVQSIMPNSPMALSNTTPNLSDLSMALPGFGGYGGGSGITPMESIALTNTTPDFSDLSMALPDMGQITAPGGKGGGFMSAISSLFSGKGGGIGAALLSTALGMFGGDKKSKSNGPPGWGAVPGIIGEMGAIDTTGTAVAGHSNPIADILNLAISAFTGNFGAGGGMSIGKTFGNMGSSMMGNLGKMGSMFAGLFSEGGLSTQPVTGSMFSSASFRDVPHYREGTHNTSGIPAMLHPNEAVIPLSRGRSVPVELNDNGGGRSINIGGPVFNISTPDANSFRQAQGATERQINRTMRRSARRNLTG